MKTAKFIERFPLLWHTGRAGMWEDARHHGLLSVSAVLDEFGVQGEERDRYESQRRARSMELRGPDGRSVWLRDQKPLSLVRLAKLLDGGMSCEDWLRTLNARVYFWCRRERLDRFLAAYPSVEQDVITVSTKRLLSIHGSRVQLAHLNTGATRFTKGRRGPATFQAVERFERPPSSVAEVTCVGRVPDIAAVTERVDRVRGDEPIRALYERPPA